MTKVKVRIIKEQEIADMGGFGGLVCVGFTMVEEYVEEMGYSFGQVTFLLNFNLDFNTSFHCRNLRSNIKDDLRVSVG